MKRVARLLKVLAASALMSFAVAGCESTDGGHVSGSVYYGTGFYDPWYYGYYDDPDIIVTPPPGGGHPGDPPRPTHPIATPPVATPRPTPMPSIPSAPRPMPRPSMRR